MNEPCAVYKGSIVPVSQVGVSLHDAGFVFGATVTDLCRTFRHRPYRLADHIDRFLRGCAYTSIPLPSSARQLQEWAETLASRNSALISSDQELAIVFLTTPGPIGYYLGEPGGIGDQGPSFFLHTFPLPWDRYRGLITTGARLAVPSVRAMPAECIDPRVKIRSRLHWYLADQELRRNHPGCQALLLDLEGNVTETASSNFLLVKDGTLVSPPATSVLEGISLRVVQELAERNKIPWEFRKIPLQDCYVADEAMLTNSVVCLAGVREIDGHSLPWPGPIFRRLLKAWNEEVGLDIHGQILGFPISSEPDLDRS